MHTIRRINPYQIQMIFHPLAQRRIGRGKGRRHEEERRPRVKEKAIALNSQSPAAGTIRLLQHGDFVPGLCQTGRRSDPSYTRTNDQHCFLS